MHILCLGLNHHTAGVSLRERLAFDEDSARAALSRLGCGGTEQIHAIREMVILSTCNRVEIYAVVSEPGFAPLEAFLTDVRGVPQAEFSPHVYRMEGQAVVKHLFRVASGLDSPVIGEPQILGQVMSAFELARSQDAAGPILSRLLQAALFTGKRARSETAIGHNPASVSSVAVRLADEVVPDLREARVVVVGAGEMAELAVEALRKRGVSRIRVVNRTLDRARSLAGRWGGEATTFEKLAEALREADILITSTGAPHTIIHTDTVTQALQGRSMPRMVIMDIALPRDVDMEVGSLPGVRLYDIDAIHARLEHSLTRRAQETPQVEAILEQEMAAFMDYLRALEVTPLIAEMRTQAEAIRLAELEKTLRRMAHLSPEERKRLDQLTQALVKKLLHAPITRLRSEAGSPQAVEYAEAARALFGLEAQQGGPQ